MSSCITLKPSVLFLLLTLCGSPFPQHLLADNIISDKRKAIHINTPVESLEEETNSTPAETTEEIWERWFALYAQEELDDNADSWEDMHDALQETIAKPLNINAATCEQLEALPFLNSIQANDIVNYIRRYGAMKSKKELVAITSLDEYRRRLLECFITIGEAKAPTTAFPEKKHHQYTNELTTFVKIPTYTRKGYNDKYYGPKYKHWLKYTFSCDKSIKFGITASQDAGEPFFSRYNNKGYDYYSAYLLIDNLGPVKRLAVGRYKFSSGLGLVVNQGFNLGKMMMTQTFATPSKNVIKQHSSRSEQNYMQGVAASLKISKSLIFNAFISYKHLDATLNDDGSVATINTSGYHRTEKEIEKRNNTAMSTAGAHIAFDLASLHVGVTAVATHYNRPLVPNTSAIYRLIYPQGNDFFNASIDYSVTRRRLTFSGETATNRKGKIATLNSLSYYLTPHLSLTLIHRYFSYLYHSPHSNSFSDGGKTQNESGVFLGLWWETKGGLVVDGYLDIAYFAFPRYKVSASAYSLDTYLSAKKRIDKWTMVAKYRMRRRQKDFTLDNKQKTLAWETTHRTTVGGEWNSGKWYSDFTATATVHCFDIISRGALLSNETGLNTKRFSIAATLKYFSTNDYDSRLYSNERSPLYTFHMPAYYGNGMRYALITKWKPWQGATLTAKAGTTRYFDRDTIGSGAEQIDESSQCDIELQINIKL